MSEHVLSIPYNSPKLHPGPCSIVWEFREGQTDKHADTQTRVTTIYFASSAIHAKCNKIQTKSIGVCCENPGVTVTGLRKSYHGVEHLFGTP